MAHSKTEQLAGLVSKKHDCLYRLQVLGQKQIDLVRNGRILELLDVLGIKQRVLWELQRVERALDPFRSEDPEKRKWQNPHQREQCGQMLDRCERLLEAILQQERESEQELRRRRDQTVDDLQGAHMAIRARGAYHDSSCGSNPQLDLSSET